MITGGTTMRGKMSKPVEAIGRRQFGKLLSAGIGCGMLPLRQALAQQPFASIQPGGVVAAASAAPGTKIGPRSIISVYCSNPGQQFKAAQFPLPTSINGFSVEINEQKSPLLYVGPANGAGQVNTFMPVVPSPARVRLVYEDGLGPAIYSEVQEVEVEQQSAPSLFHRAADSPGEVIAFQHPTGVLSGTRIDEQPAVPGQIVTVYGVGGGIPSGEKDGEVPGLGERVPEYEQAGQNYVFLLKPRFVIGGGEAEVLFAGAAPGFADLNQFNITIPLNANLDDPTIYTESGQTLFIPIVGSLDEPVVAGRLIDTRGTALEGRLITIAGGAAVTDIKTKFRGHYIRNAPGGGGDLDVSISGRDPQTNELTTTRYATTSSTGQQYRKADGCRS